MYLNYPSSPLQALNGSIHNRNTSNPSPLDNFINSVHQNLKIDSASRSQCSSVDIISCEGGIGVGSSSDDQGCDRDGDRDRDHPHHYMITQESIQSRIFRPLSSRSRSSSNSFHSVNTYVMQLKFVIIVALRAILV